MTSDSRTDWRAMPAGVRVVVRHRLAEPAPDGPRLTDVLGVVVRVSDEVVVLETTRGTVQVPGAAIVLWKPIPPPPRRRVHRG
ncbi:putative acetyltransferase [Cellulomonas composti]|uniref:Histone acetyltransferase Rv0428c-like SH3 domain-containing protein n=1 Tax=Cellulomonas composti TaxID=266130 RepID=A0A511JCH4_9CELL|nr:hypothetical protein [Cellulomonas composti]GEL95707.1 hypothetical protein CCO02nite_23650 [Cellulomonas composti]